jgi:hypothetical protein
LLRCFWPESPGPARLKSLTATAAAQTAQANFSSSQPSNASVQSGQPLRSSSRGNTASECLICQLHHNLATTLFSEPATLATPQTASAQEALPAHIDLFEVTAAHSGRAPPLSFLS